MEEIEKVDQQKFDALFQDMIGNNIRFTSPMLDENKKETKKCLIYTDFTASGKGLNKIEKFINKQILPIYANVHSTVGHCAEITSKYLSEAKTKLRIYTHATGNYSIIFHGQGATGGVHKLIEVLSIKKYVSLYNNLENAYKIKEECGDKMYDHLNDSLIKKIKSQFKELFIDINFFFKIKVQHENKIKYVQTCILCEKIIEDEGYHKHIQTDLHLKNKENYEKHPKDKKWKFFDKYIDFIEEIRQNYDINTKDDFLKLINDYKRFKPVVFYSLYEHNSNSLSWRETQSEIVLVQGEYDKFYVNLKEQLEKYKNNYIKIGSFTAASNITGLLLDVDIISILMHKYKGFAFFDYAAGAPYLKIDVKIPLPDDYRDMLKFMNLKNKEKLEKDLKIKLNDNYLKLCYKDGVFFSPHKFIGGPNTPGVLITNDRIYRNHLKPSQPGGGTVEFVFNEEIDYLQDVELKEESGTPNIIGGIRLGLMLSAMGDIYPHRDILRKEEYFIKMFLNELRDVQNLYILHGKILKNKPHIPIFSFMISFGKKFLHPNYVCALLNDLFGIQSRPGCSCAPNYGKFLLGFDKDRNFEELRNILKQGKDIFKPGYVRLNLPYFYPDYIIKYVIVSIKYICKYGPLLLGLYKYNIKTGKFYHYNRIDKKYKKDKILLNYSLANFNTKKDSYKNEEFYDKKDNGSITKEELNKILKETENYLKSKKYLEETFKKDLTRIFEDYEDFGDDEKSRWFCVFFDVEELLKRNYEIQLGKGDYEKIKKLKNDFENQAKEKKKDWDIKYQDDDVESMLDYFE